MTTRKGIDHLVLAVRDLGAARERFEHIGFRTTPMGRHPWGTANHIVQFPRNFIELLAVLDPRALEPASEEHFGFGAFNDAFLDEREGMSMLVLTTEDARADAERWRARGLRVFEPFHWSRKATLPDGSEATVAFTLTFVVDPEMPGIAFFSCQQHNPQLFWKPEYQAHANGASGIRAVSIVSRDPSRHRAFFAALIDDGAVEGNGDALEVRMNGGLVRVQPPSDAGFGDAPASEDGRFFAAEIEIADPERAARCLDEGAIPFSRRGRAIHVAGEHCFGLALALVPAGDAAAPFSPGSGTSP